MYLAAVWLVLGVLLGRWRRAALVATSLSLATVMVLVGVRVELETTEATRLLLSDTSVLDPSERARLVAESLSRLIPTLTGSPMLVAPVALVVAVALRWKRQSTWQRDLAAVAALLLSVSAWCVYVSQKVFFASSHCYGTCQYELLAESLHAVHTGKLRVLGAGALCLGWLLVVGVKRWTEEVAPRSLLVVSSLVLISGVAAQLGLRARRHDTEHPVPLDASNVMPCVVGPEVSQAVPAATLDCVTFDAPYVEVARDGARIDGTRFAEPEGARSVLDSKRKLWLELNSERAFPAAVVLVASREASARDLLPWLLALRGAGFFKVGAYLKVPPIALHTRTLGVLYQRRCCLAPFMLDETSGTPLSHFDNWDTLVRATSDSALRVALR